MSKHIVAGTGCNLSCSYCYEKESREISGAKSTLDYDLDAILDRLEKFHEKDPEQAPGLHGGEPLLMDDDDIETIFEFIDDTWEDSPTIQTNATMIGDHHIELFDEYNVTVGVSCDGPIELNTQRNARHGDEDVTDDMSVETMRSIVRLVEAGVNVGIITVLTKTNAGTDERLETLLSWMDNLNQMGVEGHFNPAIPYENVQQDVSLSPDRLEDVYSRCVDWYFEKEYRSWGPFDSMQDNLKGNGLSGCVNRKCFDEETEILTRDGWKAFDEASLEDEVATLDQKTHELEWQQPTDKQAYVYDGEMLEFSSKAYDLKVTPDHSMYVSPHEEYGFQREEAERTADRSAAARFKTDASWDAERRETYEIDTVTADYQCGDALLNVESVEMDDWLEFLGWFISEGSCGIYDDVHKITIRQQDGGALDRIYGVCERMGFNPKRYDDTSIQLCSKQLVNELSPLGKAHEKYVPQYVKELPPEQIEIFLNSLWEGDGHKGNGGDKYYTTSKQLADDVQELLLKLGDTGRLYTDKREGPDGNWKTRHIVSWITHSCDPHLTGDVDRVDYNGMVYDFTVPNHTLFVRRNGKPVWTGNCDVSGAEAAQIAKGNGETSGCMKTLEAYGNGETFLQGDSTDNEFGERKERYDMLKQLPGPYTEDVQNGDVSDQGGCKGCKYWSVCNGGCPSSGVDEDWRNRTIWCGAKYTAYEKIEKRMRETFPNIQLVTDLPWDANITEQASHGRLDLKPFAAMRPDVRGRSSDSGYADVPLEYDPLIAAANVQNPENLEPGEARKRAIETLTDTSGFEAKVRAHELRVGEENVAVDYENQIVYTDTTDGDATIPENTDSVENQSRDDTDSNGECGCGGDCGCSDSHEETSDGSVSPDPDGWRQIDGGVEE
jgi:radical SAM protein with 4Fe4S-binding SPASM domain